MLCNESGSIQNDAFHFKFKHSATNGILEAMSLKPGHVFDVGQLRIDVHPIVCHTGIRGLREMLNIDVSI